MVGRGEWRTLRPASGVSGPHRLRRTLAPVPSSASLLPSATRPSTFAPSSTSQADEFQATRQTDRPNSTTRPWHRQTRPQATPRSRLYRPGEERVCKFADQKAIGGGATPPLGQPLVGQKGGVSLFRSVFPPTGIHIQRAWRRGHTAPRSPIGRRKRGREAPVIRFLPRKGLHSHSRMRLATITERALDSSTFGVHRWCGCWLWKEKGEGGGRFAVVVGPLLGVV